MGIYCQKDEIRLQLGSVRLEDDNRCLSDCNIRSKDKVNMSLLIRAGNIQCGRISFTNAIILAGEGGSAEGITKMQMCDRGPRYHVVVKGLNFLAHCDKDDCLSQGNIVVVNIGLKQDAIDLSYYLNKKLICPVCDSQIPSARCTGMGLHWCRAFIEYKTADGKEDEYKLNVGDEFHKFASTKIEDEVEYQYIRITLKPYENIA